MAYEGNRLAQRVGNRRESLWALLGYGAMMRDAGNYDEARRFIERAARRAVALRRRKEAGMAYHDLYVIAVEQERYPLAIRHALSAFQLYPVRNPSIPRLAHDVAFLLIRLNHFAEALSIITRAIPLMTQAVERALAWSSLAWAAGGAGIIVPFREAEAAAMEELTAHPDYAPAILIHLAEGARALRQWSDAFSYADAARERAEVAGTPTLKAEAAVLVASINTRQSAPPQADSTPQIEMLTALVLDRLGRWRPARGPV